MAISGWKRISARNSIERGMGRVRIDGNTPTTRLCVPFQIALISCDAIRETDTKSLSGTGQPSLNAGGQLYIPKPPGERAPDGKIDRDNWVVKEPNE